MTRLRRFANASRWMLGIYLALLVASWITQAVTPPRYARSNGSHTLEVPALGPDGAVPNHKPVTLSYTDSGPRGAPVLVLLHGSPGDKTNFNLLIHELADTYRVIAFDMPGFGGSSKSVPDYGIDSNARYALALMDELGIKHASVLGFSLGSGAALHMHQLAPDRVDALIFYGGIGIQEGEGSGDYYFEHLKYAIAHGLFVWGRDLIPHFGYLGSRSFHNAWTQNFWDTDQRPLREILEGLTPDTPMLILHGRDDPLVPAWTAYQHHEIVEHSQLVMHDASHFMVFFKDKAKLLADDIRAFLDQYIRHPPQERPPGQRSTTDHTEHRAPHQSPLPFGWDLRRGMSPWAQMGIIIVATYILEDPTTIFTGLMIEEGQVDLFVGVFAIIIGIFTGDLALYLFGWIFGRRALAWKPLAKRLPTQHVERLGEWFDRHGWTAVLASRFIPGTRLPLYVSAGALGKKPGRFALWTFLAVLIWSIIMIIAVITLGHAATSPFKKLFGNRTVALIAVILVLLVGIRVVIGMTTSIGRARLWVKLQKLWRWEFWPLWLFYPPVLLYIAYLAIRYGGFKTATAVNPAIPASGFVDESKIDILKHLPQPWIIPSVVVQSADELRTAMQQRGWAFPLILKPDAGQRGFGLRKIRSDEQLDAYFDAHPRDVLAQTYHPGPNEAGIFYMRMPDEDEGFIFSLADKEFPVITGNGRHTLEQLILRHRRFAMQWPLFLRRHDAHRDRVLEEGERFLLAASGNHCQGTKFLDGSHLITPALTRRIDQIAKQYDGFYFGRFDVRYQNPEAFRQGEGFAIIELNGLTSEASHIFDPKLGLINAYRTLFRQWRYAFRIGAINRQHGAKTTSLPELWRMIRHHYKTRTKANALAD